METISRNNSTMRLTLFVSDYSHFITKCEFDQINDRATGCSLERI